jgi:cytochrome b
MSTMNDNKPRILVWDAPVRVFHWLLVLSFFGAFVTAESEYWRLVHVTLGYTVGGLVLFRLLWGLIGTRHARFASFVRGPAAVGRYIGTLLRGQPAHPVGHNPAGALAIVLLLLLSVVTVASGWLTYEDLGGHWLEELHEGAANFMLLVVGVHVAGVAVSSWLHRENLVRAMLDGRKQGAPDQGIRWSWWPLALLLLAAVLGFWFLQWQGAA